MKTVFSVAVEAPVGQLEHFLHDWPKCNTTNAHVCKPALQLLCVVVAVEGSVYTRICLNQCHPTWVTMYFICNALYVINKNKLNCID